MNDKIIIGAILGYLFSTILVALIFKYHDKYRMLVEDDSLTYEDSEFTKKILTYCPILNTFVVLNYLWNVLKWIIR